jgi:hypothetical protein
MMTANAWPESFRKVYDFIVFGCDVAAIGRAFFPQGSEFATLTLSLVTFGVGFPMRRLSSCRLVLREIDNFDLGHKRFRLRGHRDAA